MFKLLIFLIVTTILLITTLNLELETNTGSSVEYIKLKRIGGIGITIAWIGFIVLGLLI